VAKACGGTFPYWEITSEAIYSKEQYCIQYVKDLFDELDKDRSGTLTMNELKNLVNGKAFRASSESLSHLMSEIDVNRDGVISFDEFLQWALDFGNVVKRSEMEQLVGGPLAALDELSVQLDGVM